MSTWEDRLKAVMGGRGYENCMRRSLQSVILYEAKRCVAPRLPSLRPFQRKLAFVDQAHALVESLDFLFPHQKEEILWRTAVSKEVLTAEMAWKREKLIEKELANLSKQIKPFLGRGRSHQESCDMLTQMLFVSFNKQIRIRALLHTQLVLLTSFFSKTGTTGWSQGQACPRELGTRSQPLHHDVSALLQGRRVGSEFPSSCTSQRDCGSGRKAKGRLQHYALFACAAIRQATSQGKWPGW